MFQENGSFADYCIEKFKEILTIIKLWMFFLAYLSILNDFDSIFKLNIY